MTLVNTRHFREAGLDPGYDKLKTWTWEDFDTAADKLTVRSGTEVQRAGYQVKVPDGRHLAVWMYSQGGSLYNKDYTGLAVNNEQGVRALEHLLALLNGKRVSNGLGGALTDLFLQGKATMAQGGNWQVQELKLKNPALEFEMIAYPRYRPGGQVRHRHLGQHGDHAQGHQGPRPGVGVPHLARRPAGGPQAAGGAQPVRAPAGLLRQRGVEGADEGDPPAAADAGHRRRRRGASRPALRPDGGGAAAGFTAVMNGQTSPKTAVADLEQAARPLLAELPAAAR